MPRVPDEDRARIRARVAEGVSQAEVARREGLAESTVSRIVRDVDRAWQPEVLERPTVQPLHQAGMTPAQIAASLVVDEDMVRRCLRRHFLPMVSDDWLRKRYLESGHTTTEISAEIGCSAMIVHRYLRRAAIPTRPRGPRPAGGQPGGSI